MFSVLSKWFVNNLFLHFGQKKVESWAAYILVHTTTVVWLLGVNHKLLNNKTVSPHLINPGVVLLLPELRLVPELVGSSLLSIHGKSQTGGEPSPSQWPSLPLHLPQLTGSALRAAVAVGGSVGMGSPLHVGHEPAHSTVTTVQRSLIWLI